MKLLPPITSQQTLFEKNLRELWLFAADLADSLSSSDESLVRLVLIARLDGDILTYLL